MCLVSIPPLCQNIYTKGVPGIHLPCVGFLPSPPREASAIWAEKFHTDDVNLPKFRHCFWMVLYTKYSLKTSTVNSRLTLSAILTQTKIIMLIIQEVIIIREHPTRMYLKICFFALIQWITFPQNLFFNIFHVAGIHTGVPHSPERRLRISISQQSSLRKFLPAKSYYQGFFSSQQLMTRANYNKNENH